MLNDHHSIFTTKDDLGDLPRTDLLDDPDANIKQIEKNIQRITNQNKNFLLLIIVPDKTREKREVSEETLDLEPTNEPPSGPILYRGKSRSDKTKDSYGLLYSALPLQLKINSTVLYLGEPQADLIYVDTLPKSTTTRLNVNIPNVDDTGRKITLRFIFTWANSYWDLGSVKITDSEMIDNELKVDKEITAPDQFSYHCTGSTVFSDPENDIYLEATNLQVQINSQSGVFDDAYDCVSFTTVPIWSGLLVVGLLIFALFLSLIAIGDIKTMDKFDNQKTKPLTITFSE